jgi:hypothetical protein
VRITSTFTRDDLKTLALAVVVRGYAAIGGPPLDVAAKLLFKPRSGRGQRSDPVRLFKPVLRIPYGTNRQRIRSAQRTNADEKQSTMETKKRAS